MPTFVSAAISVVCMPTRASPTIQFFEWRQWHHLCSKYSKHGSRYHNRCLSNECSSSK